MTLDAGDLDRIEAEARENVGVFFASGDGWSPDPDDVLALVAEVRRLREGQRGYSVTMNSKGYDVEPLDVEPAPLNKTGRWERDGLAFVLRPAGHVLGLFLSQVPVYGHWEVAREADEYSVAVTANDLEAAAAIIRNVDQGTL